MTAPTLDFQDSVFTATRAVNLAQDNIADRQEMAKNGWADSVRTGLPHIDAYLNPFLAGDLVTVLGRPQNGKSFMLQYIFNNAVKGILESGKTNKCCIFVTWEVSVERAVMYWLASNAGISVTDMIRGGLSDEQMEKFGVACVKVGQLPIFIIGHSTKRKQNRRVRPNLTTVNVQGAIDYIVNEYRTEEGEILDPQFISLDYLQRIPKPEKTQRNEHMLSCVDWANKLAFFCGCPVGLAVQAGRAVDERRIQMPTMSDGQWTSNVEQSSDFSLGVWMPKTSRQVVVPAFANLTEDISVHDRLMLVGVLKQKDGPAGDVFKLHVEPEKMVAYPIS